MHLNMINYNAMSTLPIIVMLLDCISIIITMSPCILYMYHTNKYTRIVSSYLLYVL